MKFKFNFYIVASLMLLMMTFYGCKKDDKNSKATKDFIEIENGTYNSSNIPAGGSGSMGEITANSRALEGGSSPITISNSTTITDVIVGVSGASGYYKVPVSALQTQRSQLKSTGNGYSVVILYSDNIPDETFTLLIKLYNAATGLYSAATEIDVTTLQQSSIGKLQVSLSWDLLKDIDLHLVEPDQNEIFYLNEGEISYDWVKMMADHPNDFADLTQAEMAQYILDDESTTGVLDLDSNPGCSIDSVNNENIIYVFPSDISTGEYIVRVDFYSDCNAGGIGTTNYIVTARYDGELITPSFGSNPYTGKFESGTDDHGSYGAGAEVMRFNITQVKNANDKQVIHLMKKSNHTKINLEKIQQGLLNKK